MNMHKVGPTFGTLAALILVGGLAVLGAQEAQNPIEGQLQSVDPDTMSLVVLTADGAEHQFLYTAETEVIGAQEGAEGLASQTGREVTVHWAAGEEEGQLNTATAIEIRS